MTRNEYLAAVEDALDFLESGARAEVLADMAELYDGLSERGMNRCSAWDHHRMSSFVVPLGMSFFLAACLKDMRAYLPFTLRLT